MAKIPIYSFIIIMEFFWVSGVITNVFVGKLFISCDVAEYEAYYWLNITTVLKNLFELLCRFNGTSDPMVVII